MKKSYRNPILEIVLLDKVDLIATSNPPTASAEGDGEVHDWLNLD